MRRRSTRTRSVFKDNLIDAEADSTDGLESKKRSRGGKWTQEETESLVCLLLEHSKNGILNKETNATTNAIKKAHWNKIHGHFNSSNVVIIIITCSWFCF